jgi:hypothetical protein
VEAVLFFEKKFDMIKTIGIIVHRVSNNPLGEGEKEAHEQQENRCG